MAIRDVIEECRLRAVSFFGLCELTILGIRSAGYDPEPTTATSDTTEQDRPKMDSDTEIVVIPEGSQGRASVASGGQPVSDVYKGVYEASTAQPFQCEPGKSCCGSQYRFGGRRNAKGHAVRDRFSVIDSLATSRYPDRSEYVTKHPAPGPFPRRRMCDPISYGGNGLVRGISLMSNRSDTIAWQTGHGLARSTCSACRSTESRLGRPRGRDFHRALNSLMASSSRLIPICIPC